MGMLAADRELAQQDQARLRNRALANWMLSAGPAGHQRVNVTCDLYEHEGQAYAVVGTYDHQILAWYRVTGRSGRICLQREAAAAPPDFILAAYLLAVHSRSAGLRARSRVLAARSAQLRTRSESAYARAAQSRRHAAEVHERLPQLPGRPDRHSRPATEASSQAAPGGGAGR